MRTRRMSFVGPALQLDKARGDAGGRSVYTRLLFDVPLTDCTYMQKTVPNNNYGNSNILLLATDFQEDARLLIWADLSAYMGSNLARAELWMYRTTGSGDAHHNHVLRVLLEWVEMQATWNNRKTGVPWNAPGMGLGDCEWDDAGDLKVNGMNVWYHSDITDLVAPWLSGAKVNYGLMMFVGAFGDPGAVFASDDAVAAQRPFLRLTLA